MACRTFFQSFPLRLIDTIIHHLRKQLHDNHPNLSMTLWKPLTQPPLRTLILLLAILGLIALAYLLYPTGKTIRDGRHDLGTNGIWLQHGWLGHDEWFRENQRDPNLFRNDRALEELSTRLQRQGMRSLFPHLCPCRPDGSIARVDAAQTERFLEHFSDFEVIPWIGGVYQVHCFPASPTWRQKFVATTLDLLESHPRLAGIQVNIEPMPSGNEHFLQLLDQLQAALPPSKILSVAAYPPPTRWHPFPEVHWEEDYFRQVAERSDLIVPMMYDTAIRFPKAYQQLMKSWTREVLSWSGETPVLLGLPAYDDAGSGYHDPAVENLENAFQGIHAGLTGFNTLPENYHGVALYSEWELEPQEWQLFAREFRKN
jgi:hypothetical protein